MPSLEISLHPGQAVIHNSDARFKVCAAGRRFGKTHLAAAELLINALKAEHNGYELNEGHEVYYIAPTFEQGKRAMWPKLKIMGKYGHPDSVIKGLHENTGVVTLINGRRISIKGTDNPDSLRGIGLSFCVLDEYADMKANVWDEIIRPALMDVRGDALFIGTPKGKNHFYELFERSLTGVAGPEWDAFTFTSRDNPTLAAEEVQGMYNNPNYSRELVLQELEASFITRGGGFLKESGWIYDQYEPGDGYWVVAVDLAGFQNADGSKTKKRLDETAIVVAKICRRGWWVKEIIHGQWDTRQTALRIILAARDVGAARVGIEKTSLMHAVMPYLKDEMVRYGQFYQIEPLSHGNARKQDRIAWALEGRLSKGRIILNSPEGLDFYERAPWIRKLIEQANDFPSHLTKDDLIDALAYVDHLGGTIMYDMQDSPEDDWQPLDDIAGY